MTSAIRLHVLAAVASTGLSLSAPAQARQATTSVGNSRPPLNSLTRFVSGRLSRTSGPAAFLSAKSVREGLFHAGPSVSIRASV
jgi:hypothetical protein